jgi:hypothetical protein
VTASDISDIVSGIWGGDYSTLGTGPSSFGSLLLSMDSQLESVVTFPAGAITHNYNVQEADTTPIAGATIWVSTDLAGLNIIWTGTTDAFGDARNILNDEPLLDAGTYYFWRHHANYTFANPDTEVVS